ncbi:MAG: ATP-binding protein [Myxococcaceae bacterium]
MFFQNKKEFQSIVLMFLMFLVSENMYFGDRKTPTTLLIDEAWDLLHGEGSKTFIEGLARRARKYCGNIITGTQSVNDYYKTSATIAAFENTDWIVLLAQKKESVELLEKSGRIVMNDSLKQTLNSLRMVDHQYSEALIYGPRGSAVGRLILDPYSIALYSSKAQDFARITELSQQGHTLAEALEKIADEKIAEKETSKKQRFFGFEEFQKVFRYTESKVQNGEIADPSAGLEEAFEAVAQERLQVILSHQPSHRKEVML